MAENYYPRHVYKKDGPEVITIKGTKYEYASKLVKGESDLKDALKEGYVDSFEDALFAKEPEAVTTAEDPVVDDDF